MKYWKCEFVSQKTKHPEGEKSVLLYVANRQKGKAAIEAKELICGPAYEGENGEFFKAPKLDESTKEEFDAFFAGGESDDGISRSSHGGHHRGDYFDAHVCVGKRKTTRGWYQ